MTGAKPFSIRIFLEEGAPDGVRMVTKSNWDGCCVVCPRARFSATRVRDEYGYPGVYVLVGDSADSPFPTVYIGEGDPVRARLDGHLAQKDFWQLAFVFVSSAQRLNKAHIQYLEAELVSRAKSLKRCSLDNANTPSAPSLTPADRADADLFLQEMLLVLPALGVSAFDAPRSATSAAQRLFMTGRSLRASASLTPSGIVVLQNSQAVKEERRSAPASLCDLRRSLIEKGVLGDGGEHLRFTQDFEFSSPSLAASVIMGGNTNGREAWKNSAGKSLNDLESTAG
jgi:hypothetical protein